MKRFFFISILLCSFFMSNAQDSSRYINAMKANLAQLDTAYKNPAGVQKLANNFERIALAEKDKWLPYYYAALCDLNYAFAQKEMTDALAERSAGWIAKADSLSPNNSEISVLKSMNATIRMLVNPQQRYMQYGPAIETAIQQAKAQDPSNPRPYYLKGANLKGTPAAFGGGCKAALVELNTAKEKFGTFKPATPLSPEWGLESTDAMIAECNK